MVGIYKITSPSGKIYVGKSINIKRRIKAYKYLNCKSQYALYASFKKYGVDTHMFEIIHELPQDVNNDTICRLEIFYIQQYKDCGFIMLNMTNGGEGVSGTKKSDDAKMKISLANKGRANPYKGMKRLLSEEARKNISNAHKGKIVSEETIRKTQLGKLGYSHSNETREKMSKTRKGKEPWNKGLKNIYSDKTLKKMSESHTKQKQAA